MRIFTLDLSRANTGWSTLIPKSIECGSFRAPGEFDPEVFWNFESWLVDKFEHYRKTPEPITHVAIERVYSSGAGKLVPTEDLAGPGFKVQSLMSFDSMAYLLGFRSIAMAKCQQYGLPIYMPTVIQWRASIFGKGVKPPTTCNTRDKRTRWWKKHAVEYCRLLNITVPDADAAEAVCIAFWLRAQLQHERYQQGSML